MADRQTIASGLEPAVTVSAQSLTDIAAAAALAHLQILGGFHAQNDPSLPARSQTLLMFGPAEGFWAHFTTQPEWADGARDPMDRWSRRVIGRMACNFGAKALFPFGGAPYHPFYTWALRTGRMWQSPIKLLVHDTQGLMVSFRGAMALQQRLELPAPTPNPCTNCPAPCTTTCPALSPKAYNTAACHTMLDAGKDCMSLGCASRRACPVGQGYARLPQHSVYHMRQFHQ